eukprot:1119226-Prorocentrum_minimum.AAC.1
MRVCVDPQAREHSRERDREGRDAPAGTSKVGLHTAVKPLLSHSTTGEINSSPLTPPVAVAPPFGGADPPASLLPPS